MKKLVAFLLGMAFLVGSAGVATASLTNYYDRGTFNSQGTIVYNYGYEDFGTGFSYPPNPWTSHGVTYTTGDNLIVGTGTSYAPISNVFAYDSWSPITADIDTNAPYDMIGIDLGYLDTFSLITCEIYTNLGTYVYSDMSAPLASTALDFYGLIADPGEYFTGFMISSAQGMGSAPVIDNVTLGNASTVPEPATMLFFGSGLLGLAGLGRRFGKR